LRRVISSGAIEMSQRKPVDAKAGVLMALLCAVWGFQQVALKAAAPDMAPVLQVAVRSGAAALLVFALVLWRGEAGAMRAGILKPGLAAGALFALEFLCVGEGLRFTNASHMAIFLYTAPVFAAIGLHLKLPEERLSPGQWIGIALAFAGVAVAVAGRGAGGAEPDGRAMWIGDLLGVAAGLSLGATTLVVRFTRLAETPATVTLLYQLLAGFGLLLAVAGLSGQTRIAPTPVLLSSLAFQIVLVSFASYLAWFALLRTYLASRLGALSFMTPMFGVVFGVTVLGERLDLSFLLGALMILAGIALVNARDVFAKASAGSARRAVLCAGPRAQR
jgi:drug/metabolite transporter (DMT)-like permease